MVELVPERAAPALLGRRRWLVVGNCGSGKSTLARVLAPRLGLPLVSLDREYWRAGWRPTPHDEWVERVRELLAPDDWIIEGDYSATLPLRLRRADAVLHLDLPRLTCLARVLGRVVVQGPRPDLPAGCPERFDASFVRWVWSHAERSRPVLLERLAAASATRPVARLRDANQVSRFLAALEEVSSAGRPRPGGPARGPAGAEGRAT